jgi:predicted phosphoribosyltransferase
VSYIDKQIKLLKNEISRKISVFGVDLNRTFQRVILCDDGIATGATVIVAVRWLRSKGIGQIILALPVAPLKSMEEISPKVDKMVALEVPEDFSAVGQFYREFDQVSDRNVIQILRDKNKKFPNI